MIWLVLGVALWSGAHFFKRVAPEARARMGERGKGVIAVVLLLSIVLMVIGYRAWLSPQLWIPPVWMTHLNNLLVLIAFYLFAASGAKTRVTRSVRHPQLTAFLIWSGAHVLVNGNLASLVLFGGLFVWAAVEIVVINRAEPEWTPPAHDIPIRKEITAVIAAVVAYVVVGLIHGWIGPWPFGG